MIFRAKKIVPIAGKSLGSEIMGLQIRKRTGELVPFEKNKIREAILSAFKDEIGRAHV